MSSARTRFVLSSLMVLGASSPALAWPADVYVDLEVGKERFERPSALEWAEVEDPKIASVEILESGELLLTGNSIGRTLVLLYAEGRFAVWRVRVSAARARVLGAPDEPERWQAAKKACPGMKEEGAALSAYVKDEGCRKALLHAFESDRFRAKDIQLTFELLALQAQLSDLEAALAKAGLRSLKLHYRGAGLVVQGKVSPEEHRKALWTLFRHTLGRVPLEDRLDVRTERQEP